MRHLLLSFVLVACVAALDTDDSFTHQKFRETRWATPTADLDSASHLAVLGRATHPVLARPARAVSSQSTKSHSETSHSSSSVSQSRPARWATPTADQGNGAGAAVAGVPPAANPVLARPVRAVSSQSTKSHSESSHSSSSVSQSRPARWATPTADLDSASHLAVLGRATHPVLARPARAVSSQSTQSHSESSHSSSSVSQSRPARWATPTADLDGASHLAALPTANHPVLARPVRGVTTHTSSSHSESSQKSTSTSQTGPTVAAPLPARVARHSETQQQGVDHERPARAGEIQENLRKEIGNSRQNRNVHTQEGDEHAPIVRPARGAENQGQRSDHTHQIEAQAGRQNRNVHTQDGDNHSPLERETRDNHTPLERDTRAARNGGPDLVLGHPLLSPIAREIRSVNGQQSGDGHVRQQRHDPSDPMTWHRGSSVISQGPSAQLHTTDPMALRPGL